MDNKSDWFKWENKNVKNAIMNGLAFWKSQNNALIVRA